MHPQAGSNDSRVQKKTTLFSLKHTNCVGLPIAHPKIISQKISVSKSAKCQGRFCQLNHSSNKWKCTGAGWAEGEGYTKWPMCFFLRRWSRKESLWWVTYSWNRTRSDLELRSMEVSGSGKRCKQSICGLHTMCSYCMYCLRSWVEVQPTLAEVASIGNIHWSGDPCKVKINWCPCWFDEKNSLVPWGPDIKLPEEICSEIFQVSVDWWIPIRRWLFSYSQILKGFKMRWCMLMYRILHMDS